MISEQQLTDEFTRKCQGRPEHDRPEFCGATPADEAEIAERLYEEAHDYLP